MNELNFLSYNLEFVAVTIALKIRQHKWIEKFIKGFNFIFEYHPSQANASINILS